MGGEDDDEEEEDGKAEECGNQKAGDVEGTRQWVHPAAPRARSEEQGG